jgi:uncharacterized protein with ATP-grasp and redox domains
VKAESYCKDCLKALARQVVALSHGGEGLVASASHLVETLFDADRPPTEVSNRLLKYVRGETGVYDPYEERKEIEFRRAVAAFSKLKGFFPDTLEGALRSSAFGNGGDFFREHSYDVSTMEFVGDVAKIAHQVYISRKILVLGDNLGDFVFDLPLLHLLRREGKDVFYAVKEHPVQNDMSLSDVTRFMAHDMWEGIISTGTDEVGLRREEMTGVIEECWEDGSMIIAKGMGNYETVSEYDRQRPVVYVMSVKCRTVAGALGLKIGTYTALAGGDHG